MNNARESWKHDLSALAKTAGLEEELAGALKRDPELNLNWRILKKREPENRYQKASQDEANALINALEDRDHGIFRWLKRLW